jgi:hypothetical protein
MRYSRFRQQMDGTTGTPRAKRKQKKPKVVDPPSGSQRMLPMAQSSTLSTVGSMDTSLPTNIFIKSEPGTQGSPWIQNSMHYNPLSMSESNLQGQYYFPQDFASMQFKIASGMQSGLAPSSSLATSSSFVNHYLSDGMSPGHASSSSGIQGGYGFRDTEMQNIFPHISSNIDWEPQASLCLRPTAIKSEESEQSNSLIPWEPLGSPQETSMTTMTVDQHQPIQAMAWETPSSPQRSDTATTIEPSQPNLAMIREPQDSPQQNLQFRRYEQHQGNFAITREPLSSSPQNITLTTSAEQRHNNSFISCETQPFSRQVSQLIKSEEQQEDSQMITLLELAPSLPQDMLATEGEEQQPDNQDITWDTLPPPAEDSPPAEAEQQPSNAMVLWQPIPPFYQSTLTAQPEEHQDINMITDWHPDSSTRQNIPIVNLDEGGHGKDEFLATDEQPTHEASVTVDTILGQGDVVMMG